MFERVRVELPMEELKGFKLGDKVTVSITGLVAELIAGKDPSTGEDKKYSDGELGEYKPPACLYIEKDKCSVRKVGDNQFDALSDEGDY